MKLNYIVGLHEIKIRQGRVYLLSTAQWVSDHAKVGPRTGKSKVPMTRDRDKAYGFSKVTAEAMASMLRGWGYFPKVETK